MNSTPLDGWRALVNRRPIAAALIAGFVATHMTTMICYWFKIVGLPILDYNFFNGLLLIPYEGVSPLQQHIWGAIAHYFTGLCWALIFAFLVFPLFSRWGNSLGSNLGKGLLWGLILGTLSALLWVPRQFPDFDPGFFSNNLGWKTVLAIYVSHAVYGLTLGSFWNPLRPLAVEAEPERAR